MGGGNGHYCEVVTSTRFRTPDIPCWRISGEIINRKPSRYSSVSRDGRTRERWAGLSGGQWYRKPFFLTCEGSRSTVTAFPFVHSKRGVFFSMCVSITSGRQTVMWVSVE